MPRLFAPLLAALVLVPAVLSTAVPARADSGHSSGSAADQYVEAIPSGGSNTPTGGPAGKAAPIQPTVKRAIKRAGGSDKAALRAIVSSPSFGAALAGHARPPIGAPIRVDDVSRIVADEKVGAGTVVSATFDSGYGAFAVLLAAALLGAATANVLRAMRRRAT